MIWFNVHRNACRCTGYKQLVNAVMDAAKLLRGEMKAEDLMYKIPEDGKIFGGKYPRPSALAKVTGTLDYGADLGLKLPQGTLQLALVPTLVPGINTSQVGEILKAAVKWSPIVRAVHFQPVSYFGRCLPVKGDRVRLTLPDLMRSIENQTDGMFKVSQFKPPGCENARCSFHGNYMTMKASIM